MRQHPRRSLYVFHFATLLAACLAVMGCQVVIGVSDLEVTGASGGATCSGCEPNFGCDKSGTACSTTCDASSGCAPTSVCFLQPSMCQSCGAAPPLAPCPGMLHQACDSCEMATGTCVMKCDAPDKCATNRTFDGTGTPVRVDCNDQCDDITITTVGTAPTEVVCGAGCNGLTLNCSIDGSCALRCNGSGCVNAKVNCGGNSCLAVCKGGPVAIEQTCGSSCSCTKIDCK